MNGGAGFFLLVFTLGIYIALAAALGLGLYFTIAAATGITIGMIAAEAIRWTSSRREVIGILDADGKQPKMAPTVNSPLSQGEALPEPVKKVSKRPKRRKPSRAWVCHCKTKNYATATACSHCGKAKPAAA